MYIMITRWFGTFVFERLDGEWKEVDFLPASKDPKTIASELGSMNNGEVLERERVLLDRFDIEMVMEERISNKNGPGMLTDNGPEVPAPSDKGFQMNTLAEANIELAALTSVEGPGDANILSAIGALTEVDASLNTTTERIREWYAKHWPEISEVIDERSVLIALSTSPEPENVIGSLRESDPKLAELLEKGDLPDLEEMDLSGIAPLASLAVSHWKVREELEGYVESEMELCAPNLAMVAGPLIGARLIDSASGLERLARLPASTVQVLGAEKMFFKFLKEGGKPPKHGILFQHPWVHSLPTRKRGKMARSIASAASLAARMDAYGGGDATEIKERLEKRAQRIIDMELKPPTGSGRQPPFREGWWANKGGGKKGRKRGRRKR